MHRIRTKTHRIHDMYTHMQIYMIQVQMQMRIHMPIPMPMPVPMHTLKHMWWQFARDTW